MGGAGDKFGWLCSVPGLLRSFTFGLEHDWMNFLRALPDMKDLITPLELAIADVLMA